MADVLRGQLHEARSQSAAAATKAEDLERQLASILEQRAQQLAQQVTCCVHFMRENLLIVCLENVCRLVCNGGLGIVLFATDAYSSLLRIVHCCSTLPLMVS